MHCVDLSCHTSDAVVCDTASLIRSYDRMRSGSCGVSSCARTDKTSSSIMDWEELDGDGDGGGGGVSGSPGCMSHQVSDILRGHEEDSGAITFICTFLLHYSFMNACSLCLL